MAMLSSPFAFVVATPPVTRYFTILTVVFSLLHAWLWWNGTTLVPYLLLVPGQSLFYPWTFLTSALVEPTILEFILSIVFVPAGLRYLERLWGSIEILKFLAAVVGVSNIIAFAFNWIEFVATKNADLFLYGMQYHGQMTIQMGLLVAFTQLIPEHHVQLMGVIKVRVKSLPMAYLTISTVMCFIGFQSPWIIIQFGWYVAWVYLRFYKKSHSDTPGGMDTYGDRSETFALVSWFPPFLHTPLTVGGNLVHSLASRFHLIPASSPNDIEGGSYSATPGGARAEAERRRAMALKALDQRVGAVPSGLQGSPSSVALQTPRPAPTAASPRVDSIPAAPARKGTGSDEEPGTDADKNAR